MASIKLKYDEEADQPEVLAYVDGAGDLIILDQTGENEAMAIYVEPYGEERSVILTTASWEPEEAQHKFYKGDTVKLTITF